jgi:hypothetical protein
MPVTQVIIENIIPSSMDVDIQWSSDQITTTTVSVYVAVTEVDLANPTNRVTGHPVGIPDTVFRMVVPDISASGTPLRANTQYYTQCECDSILSPISSFVTLEATPIVFLPSGVPNA